MQNDVSAIASNYQLIFTIQLCPSVRTKPAPLLQQLIGPADNTKLSKRAVCCSCLIVAATQLNTSHIHTNHFASCLVSSAPAAMAILNELGVPCQTKCVLPPSTKSAERALFPPARGHLKEHIPLPSNGVLCPSIVMAAWALTLRCFIVADVFSFRCCQPATSTCVARVDLDEPVATFVRRFAAHGEATSGSAMTEVPVGPFVSFVPDQASASHQCNTAVRVSDCERELASAKTIGTYVSHSLMDISRSC